MKRLTLPDVGLALAVLLSTPGARGDGPAGYDLEQDRKQRIELARQELGARTRTRVVEGVFVVVGQADAVGLMERATAAYFNQRFDRRPEQAISVYLFPSSQQYDCLLPEAARRTVRIDLWLLSPGPAAHRDECGARVGHADA